ncbi:hypothetical protein ACH4FX_21705 [Streptomyces sp. NPDC018019]|uniref:hypothetical protein n=1 Tax=Streptomyces sp. NPDC018019 TaxID=3365030 RepID=UPI0037B2901B
MDTTIRTTTEAVPTDRPGPRRDFGRAKILVAAYGALSAVVLLTVAVLAGTGHEVTPFMWGRSAGVLASAGVAYWFTVLAARGARWAYRRIRVLSAVMPVAIVAIDSIPGALPGWFIAMQAVCAVAIGAAACIVNGSGPRAAFRAGR